MASVHEILLNVTGRSDGAMKAIRQVADGVKKDLPADQQVEFRVKARKARDQIRALRAEFDKLDRDKLDIEANVAVGKAMAQLSALDQRLDKLRDRRVTATANVRVEIDRDMARAEQTIFSIGKTLDSVAGRGVRRFGEGMRSTTQAVKSVTPVVNGLAILMVGKLLPGLLALGAAAGGAVTGILALGNAFVFALGPIGAVLVAVIQRVAKVIEAFKAQKDAAADSSRKSIQGQEAARQAADNRRRAEEQLADAQRGVAQAERGLVEARRQAGQDIADAQRRAADATRAVADAQRDLQASVVDAYRAWEDAIEDVQDGLLDLEDAQLSLDEARLSTDEAENALADLRREVGLTGPAFDDMFKRFENVDIDFDRDLFRSTAMRGGADEDQALAMERAILRVRRARLDEKKATDGVSDSQRDLKRARQEEARFTQLGIRAYAPYESALRRVSDAQRDQVDATREANRLATLGIARAPGVIAAVEAVRDAERRLVQARRESNRVRQASGLTAAQAKAKQLTDDLTGAELNFLDALKQTAGYLRGYFKPATEAVINSLAGAFRRLPGFLLPLQDAMTAIGQAMGRVIDTLSAEMVSDANVTGFRDIATRAAELVEILGSEVFLNFFRTMRNLAQAALPQLNDILTSVGNALGGFADKTGNIGKTGAAMNPLFESVRAFGDAIGPIARALFELFTGPAATAGQDFIRWIGEGASKLADFLGSAEGKQELTNFFEDVMPMVKSTIKFIITLGKVLLRAFQFAAPFIQGFTDSFTFVLELISKLLGFLNKIVSSPIGRAIRYAIGSFLGFGKVVGIVKGLFGIIARVGPKALGALGKIAGNITKPLSKMVGAAGKAIGGVAKALSKGAGKAVGGMAKGLRGAAGAVFNAGKFLVTRAVAGVRRIAGALFNAGKWVVRRYISGIRNIAGAVFRVGRFLIDKAWAGIKAGGRALFNAGSWVVRRFLTGIRNIARRVYDIGGSLLRGLVNGFTNIGRKAFNAIKGLAGKIVDKVKSVLGIKSPSRVMAGLGEAMLSGLIKGFTSGNIVGFVKKHLGGIPGLAADLAKSALIDLPLSVLGKAGDLVGLARGGVVTGPTAALIGEGRSNEAVIPLSRKVLRQLGDAIASSIHLPAPSAAFAGARPPANALSAAMTDPRFGGTRIDQINLPPAPGAAVPDARYQAAQLARELRRRGGR